MPSKRGAWAAGMLLLQGLAFWLSSYLPGLGASPTHHGWSLIAVLALSALGWRPLARSRRFLAVGVLATTALATVSGFWLLYWKEGIRVAGYQDWGVFWHVAWSWAAAVFFFQHTWINRVALGHFMRRSLARVPTAILHVGAYALVLAAFLVTWSAIGQGWFTVENYIPLSLWAWLVATVPPYAGWWAMRARAARLAVRARSQAIQTRLRARGGVDLALVPLAALAVISGLPLAFFDPEMDAQGWKYVSKFWHVWPSVAFAVLVFAHSMQTWRTMRAHWRKYGVALGDLPRPRSGPAQP